MAFCRQVDIVYSDMTSLNQDWDALKT